MRSQGRRWVDRPPPVEIRIGEAPSFLGGTHGVSSRTHWMRLRRDVGDSPMLQSALLAHASDYLLLDMLMRVPLEDEPSEPASAFSLDHALWFHRPNRFDQWHRYTEEIVALSGHRGLVRGTIHDVDDHLVASVVQEGLIHPIRKEQ